MDTNKEISVLKFISNEGNTTQREIAKLTGMSLGNINSIIKSLILKGYLLKKVDKERVVKYIITSKGKKQRSVAIFENYSSMVTTNYIFNKKLEVVLENCCVKNNLKPILIGPKDNLSIYIESILTKMNIDFEVMTINDLYSNIGEMVKKIAVIWHPDYAVLLKEVDVRFLHILDEVEKL